MSGLAWPRRSRKRKPRSAEQLPAPSAELPWASFPIASNPAKVYRAVTAGRGAWWFASAPTKPTPENSGGRFDLAAPRGTSCWADTQQVALGERLGDGMTGTLGKIPRRLLANVEIRAADGPVGKFADTGGTNVGPVYSVTGELSTTSNYPLAQSYAETFRNAGLHGIRYRARFSADGAPDAIAVFGPVGQEEDTARQVDSTIEAAEPVAVSMGLVVVGSASSVPPSAHTVVTSLPPRRTR